MRPPRLRPTNRGTESTTNTAYHRRGFLAIGASVGATLLAGCSGVTDGAGTTNAGEETDGASGTFRLLISDRPADIDDFDELAVSFDRARIFRHEEADDDGEGETDTQSTTATETAETTASTTETGTTTETATDSETTTAETTTTRTPTTRNESATTTTTDDPDGELEEEDQRGFFTRDLDGATVDLTEVVGENAIGVFDGELPTGRYAKIELYASDVEGVVDGEPASVEIPSGKLQIVKPFEVVAGETLSFVFDINVVRKGKGDDYNLLPVVSESGVAGRDVAVTEIEPGSPDTETEKPADGNGNGDGNEDGDGENQSDEPHGDS